MSTHKLFVKNVASYGNTKHWSVWPVCFLPGPPADLVLDVLGRPNDNKSRRDYNQRLF